MKTLKMFMFVAFFLVSTIVPMDLATTKDPEVVKIAQKHNSSIPLIACPDEISEKIFSYVVDINQPMEKSIKNILAISATCTYFDSSLEWFGGLLKPYSAGAKDEMLKKTAYTSDSWRRGKLLMACSGVADTKCNENLLGEAVMRSDIYMAKLLLKNGVSPNIINWLVLDRPVFFEIENPKMVTVFADHNADFNYVSKRYLNVLWYHFQKFYSGNHFSEMVQFYLKKGVNPALLNPLNGQSLLHHIANNFKDNRHASRKKSYIDAICHVLDATKEQINTIDKEGNTPLDILMKKLIKAEQKPFYGEHNIFAREVFDMSSLFRLCGARTAEELKR